MFLSLMGSRRFAPLFWCQFFSAFNDNLLKNALVFLLLFGIGGAGAPILVTLAGAVFIAPFFILSGLGGELADRYDKALLARRIRAAEVGLAALTVLGFALGSVPVLFVALGLFGVVAALFGPIKYGILPDHLRPEELPAANALVEGATFAAILFGTICGGLAGTVLGGAALGALIMGCAALCWSASLLIPPSGEGAPALRIDPNLLRSTRALLRLVREDARLWWCGSVVSWFWLVGAVVLSLLPAYVASILDGREAVVTLLLAVFAVGIALGSALAARLAHGRIFLRPVPVAAALMAVFALDLALAALGVSNAPPSRGLSEFAADPAGWRAILDLGGLAVAGGLFVVPPFAALQAWAAPDLRARIVGSVNVLSAAYMVAGALVTAALQAAGLGMAGLFGLLGLCCGAVAILATSTRPGG